VYPTKQTRSSDNGEIEQESQIDDGDSNNGDTHKDDEKRSSLSLVTTSLWKEHPVTTNTITLYDSKFHLKKCRLLLTILLYTILLYTILLFTILLFMILIFTILYKK
ncbi:unnamed protein product, partial [Brassica oleracea var. botrytis]